MNNDVKKRKLSLLTGRANREIMPMVMENMKRSSSRDDDIS